MAATEAAVLVQACRDDPAAVHAVVRPLVAGLHQIPPTDPAFLRWVPDAVQPPAALGETAAAAELLAWFEDRCRHTERRSGWAAAHRCRALLLSHQGALDAALEHILASVQLYADVGMPFERARSLLAAGRIHRRRRQKLATATALHEARAIFEQVGARGWADRATDELDRLGDRKRRDSRGDELTAAEEHVARLVAAGLRNREIAAELFMSLTTVESHLTRIYRKLGVRSRTQLGAILAPRASLDGHDRAAEHRGVPALSRGPGAQQHPQAMG